MITSFRGRILSIAATAAAAFVLVMAVGVFTLARVDDQLERIEERYVPLLAAGPELEADLEAIQTGLKDAVAAQDAELLAETEQLRDAMLGRIDRAQDSMDPGAAASLRSAVDAYYRLAHSVSARLIRGETGEQIVDAMRQMQVARTQALDELERATHVDRAELGRAFESLRRVIREADWLRFGIAVISLGLVLTASSFISSRVLRSLRELADGFARFGEGDFSRPMLVMSSDELGEVARGGNLMVAKLREADRQHKVAHWIDAGHAGLALELRGDLSPEQVAQRAITFLARHVSAPAGAFFARGDDDRFVLLGHFGLGTDVSAQSFGEGEGLVGAVAEVSEVLTVDELPGDGLRLRSGLLDAKPTSLVLVPVLHDGRVTGVVELLLTAKLSEGAREFLDRVRATLGAVLEVARVQVARRELLDDLDAQRQALEQANAALRAQTEDLDGFTYSVSHDLRAPLRAIDGFGRILEEDHGEQLDEEGLRVLGVIRSNASKMGRLIDDLLSFSRLGRQPVRAGTIDMTALARAAFDDAAAEEPDRSIELHLDSIPSAQGDASLIRQVWINLIGNAVKYTRGRAPAVITVDAHESDAEHLYVVRDNGVGFDMKYADKLFGVFQRLHDAKEFEGTGVGLALVSRIIKRHGGRLWAEAKMDEGATFTFTLPRVEGETE